MIKKIIIIGVVIILAIFQIVAIQFFSFFNIWPHLIIILMVLALFTDYEEIALYAAAFGGLVLDLVSPARFGLNIILLFIFYFLIKYLIKTKLFEINLPIVAASVFIMIIIFDLIFNLILNAPISYNLLLQGLFNALFAGIIFVFMRQRIASQTFKFEI